MHSVEDFLKIVAGVILAILVISMGFLFYNRIKDSGNSAMDKASSTTQTALDSNITQYSRSDVAGEEVRSAISNFMGSSDEIYICVDGTYYIYPSNDVSVDNRETPAETQKKLQEAKKKGSSTYISPKAKYTGVVDYDPDDSSLILGITFTRNK